MWADLVAGILRPIADIVNGVYTSDEERINAQTKMLEVQVSLSQKIMEYESRLLEMQTQIITAEAQGESWLQRSWRPITMLSFLGMILADCLGLLEFRLSEQAWDMLELGLGGYVVGRSAEKVVTAGADALVKVKRGND